MPVEKEEEEGEEGDEEEGVEKGLGPVVGWRVKRERKKKSVGWKRGETSALSLPPPPLLTKLDPRRFRPS